MALEIPITGAASAASSLAGMANPALIGLSAGASVLGGMMSNSANAKEASKQRKWQAYQSLVDREWNEKMNQYTQDYNLMEADKARNFNAAEARLSRGWQTDLANSAHQREVADLRNAGLNPILSGTGGMGANSAVSQQASAGQASVGTPHTSSGQGAMAHPMQNVSKDSVSTAIAQLKINQELEQSAATIDNTRENTNLQSAQKALAGQQAAVAEQEAIHVEAKGISERENVPLRKAYTQVEKAREELIKRQAQLTSNTAVTAGVEARANTFAERQSLGGMNATGAERLGQAAQGATSALQNFKMFGGGGNRTFNYGPKQNQTVINNP